MNVTIVLQTIHILVTAWLHLLSHSFSGKNGEGTSAAKFGLNGDLRKNKAKKTNQVFLIHDEGARTFMIHRTCSSRCTLHVIKINLPL
jgi:hypothetical protein